MSDRQISARARVTVTLELDAEGLWGGDCTVGQVHKQAIDNVRATLDSPDAMGRLVAAGKIRIVGEPLVRMVLTDERTP